MQEYRVSWEEVVKLCDLLALKLEPGEYKKIIAVSRGGLIPASLLAHRLKISQVESINLNGSGSLESFDRIKYQFCWDQDAFLVVDDIVDTGKTFKVIQGLLPYANYVALYEKPAGYDVAGLVGMQVEKQDSWLIFPWEVE